MDRVLAGRYGLEVPLGRGGFGEVWRGRNLATNQLVAIKLVQLSRIDDPGLLAETIGRFRREAAVVTELKHPNIVGALDAGRFGSELFMVMDLAQGISLAGMLEQREARRMGLLPVASVLRIARQVCAGLAAAHSAGIVHRDIKPSNLMVTSRLDITIIDFGIARLLDDNAPRLTMRGHTIGTIAYMSPEQAQGEDVDGRSDLYSLGCVLYELLSGRPPFVASLPQALLMMQVTEKAVPLSVVRPDLPAGLPELVSDLMEKDRRARPANAAQVASRIEAIAGSLRSEVPAHEADRQTVAADDPAGWTPPPRPRTRVLDSRDGDATPPWPQTRTPAWPQPPQRPTRRRWRGLVSTLITVAIAAGVGIYTWERTRGTLHVTSVTVTVANPAVGCNGTAHITGMILTNGHGGPVSYEWIRGTETNPAVLVADDASGSDTVLVNLAWAFHGKGSTQAVAKLRVLAPDPAESSVMIPYSCP